MQPTFNDGDRLLMTTNVGEFTRGEIIYFKYPRDETKFYLKRIVGIPNERIEIRDGSVFVNGQVLDEPYVDSSHNQAGSSFPEKIIPSDEFYVLGDNRDNSSDSRYWGTVKRELIVGKYYLNYGSAK